MTNSSKFQGRTEEQWTAAASQYESRSLAALDSPMPYTADEYAAMGLDCRAKAELARLTVAS